MLRLLRLAVGGSCSAGCRRILKGLLQQKRLLATVFPMANHRTHYLTPGCSPKGEGGRPLAVHKDFLSGVCEAIAHSIVLQRAFGNISPMNVFPMGSAGTVSRSSVGSTSHHDRQCDDYSSFKSFSYLRCSSAPLKQKLDADIQKAVSQLKKLPFRSVGRLSIRLFTVKEGWGFMLGPWKRGSLWEEWLLDVEPDMEPPVSVEDENLRQEELETVLQGILFSVIDLAARSRDRISPNDPKLLHDYAPFIGYELEVDVTDMQHSAAHHASLFSQIMPVLGAAAASGSGRP